MKGLPSNRATLGSGEATLPPDPGNAGTTGDEATLPPDSAGDDTLLPASAREAEATLPSDLATDATAPPDASLDDTMAADGRRNGSVPAEAERIGRFVVLRKLGAGGMGIVYAAYDPELDRRIALKLLLPDGFGSTSKAARQRLLREAQAMAKLSHPNVVAVHDVGEHGEQVFIAMEFIEGGTLQEWLGESERSWREVLDIFLAAGRGLAAAHAKDLVHRDFKPDNVMIDVEGRVRVMDFGLARAESAPVFDEQTGSSQAPRVDALNVNLTRAGAVMGTPTYMSPEQHFGEVSGPASDQFSFAVALWEALYGERPFAGNTLAELARSVTEHELRSPPSRRAVPGWLHGTLERALQVQPEDRWPSMQAFLDALVDDPTPRRRRLAMAGVGLLLIGGVVGGFGVDRAQKVAGCQAEADAIAEVWSSDRSDRLEGLFADSGLAFAGPGWAYVGRELDAYATQWGDLRQQSCLAHRLDGTADAELYRLQEACFEEGQAGLSALVEQLETGDPDTLQRAPSAVAGLVDPTTCVDERRVRQRVPAPADMEPAEVADVRRLLAKTASAGDLSRFELAATQGDEALERATSLGWRPLIAEAKLGRATIHDRQGQYDEAETLAREAFRIAGEEGHALLMARAALLLARILGDGREDAEAGLAWLDWADMIHVRLGRDEALEGLQARAMRAVLLGRDGRPKEALEIQQEVVQRLRASLGDTHPSVAKELVELGGFQRQTGDYDAALETQREALQMRIDTLGEQHPRVAVSRVALSNALERTGDADGAKRELELAIEAFEAAFAGDHPNLATALHALGGLLRHRGDLDGALAHSRRALEMRRRLLGDDHPNVARTMVSVGAVCYLRDDLDCALEQWEGALAINERRLGEDHPDLAIPLGNLGLLYEALDRDADADAAYQRALAIESAALGSDHPNLAYSLLNLGNLHVNQGQIPRAIEEFERALELVVEAQGEDHPMVGDTLINLGTAEDEREHYAEAIRHYERALAIYRKVHDEDHPDIALALCNLANTEVALDASADVEARYTEAMRIREKAYGADNSQVGTTLASWGHALLDQRQPKRALPKLERAVAIFTKGEPHDPATGATRFDLARAQWETGDRKQARSSAAEALAEMKAQGGKWEDNIESALEWMRERKLPTAAP